MKTLLLVIFGVLAVLGLAVAGGLLVTYFSYQNQDATLRVNAKNYQDVCMTVKDKNWKTISMMAQVSEEYKESFFTGYEKIIGSRYEGEKNGPALMKWITESNPQFDTKLFENVQIAVQANLAEFQVAQKNLIAIKEQHDLLRTRVPSKWFLCTLNDCPELKITIVTSAATKKMYETGEDNDVQLYQKKNK